MEIVDFNVDELISDPGNLRQHGAENLNMIKKSLQEFGQYKPLVVDKDSLVVLIGNGRLAAMKELKWKTCKCVFIDKKQYKGIDVLDNRLNELSAWKDDEIDSWLMNEKGVDWWGVDIEKSLSLLNKAKREAKKLGKEEEKTPQPKKKSTSQLCPCCGKPLKKIKAVMF